MCRRLLDEAELRLVLSKICCMETELSSCEPADESAAFWASTTLARLLVPTPLWLKWLIGRLLWALVLGELVLFWAEPGPAGEPGMATTGPPPPTTTPLPLRPGRSGRLGFTVSSRTILDREPLWLLADGVVVTPRISIVLSDYWDLDKIGYFQPLNKIDNMKSRLLIVIKLRYKTNYV